MSDERSLAAEYVLRLLEGEELIEARNRIANDPDFAAEVRWWEARLAPLIDEVAPMTPSPAVWQGIARRMGSAGAPLLSLRRGLKRWRAAALVSAMAAAILLMTNLRPDPPVQPSRSTSVQPAPLLLASLAGEEVPDALTIAYRPQSRELIVSPARLEAPTGRSRELWLIPAGGQPISLGVVATGVQRRTIPASVSNLMVAGATIALSDEPSGGSPSGQPTGTVLATGPLSAV